MVNRKYGTRFISSRFAAVEPHSVRVAFCGESGRNEPCTAFRLRLDELAAIEAGGIAKIVESSRLGARLRSEGDDQRRVIAGFLAAAGDEIDGGVGGGFESRG